VPVIARSLLLGSERIVFGEIGNSCKSLVSNEIASQRGFSLIRGYKSFQKNGIHAQVVITFHLDF